MLLVLLIMALPVAAFVYGLADRIPSEYAEALERAAVEPYEQRREYLELYGDFTKVGGPGKPFKYLITADEVNICLASMDDIALWLSDKPVKAELARAGFRDPAVAMDDGVLTLMVMSTRYEKVISVDLSFIFDERGDMRMVIRAVRVGLLPVPKGIMEDHIRQLSEKLKHLLTGKAKGRHKQLGGIAARNIAKFLSKFVSMLDGKAIRPKVIYNDFGVKHPLLIKNVRIGDGVLTLCFEPIPRRRAPARTTTAPNAEAERPEDPAGR